MSEFLTKSDIARGRRVTTRTVDNWVRRGLLPPPIKFGTAAQSRVRWSAEDVAILDARLASMTAERQAA